MNEWDFLTDTLIVGSGGGALCAALVARSHGLDALVVEKTEYTFGDR
jgi:3-oxosteroid 1-dehydrogenase